MLLPEVLAGEFHYLYCFAVTMRGCANDGLFHYATSIVSLRKCAAVPEGIVGGSLASLLVCCC